MSKGRRSTPPRLRGNYLGAATPLLSRAVGSWAAGVSKFSISVRLSVQHKCHLLIRDGIRYQRCRSSPGPPLTVSLSMPILRQSLAIALGFLTPSEYRRNMDRNLSSAVV